MLTVSFILIVVPYIQRDDATFSCPDGYQSITDPDKCENASKTLGLEYRGDRNTEEDGGICHYCGGCPDSEGGKTTRVDKTHGDAARWICELKGTSISHTTLQGCELLM